MKKTVVAFIILSSSYLSAITSAMTTRNIATEPLFFTIIDYSKKQLSLEIAPVFEQMYDSEQINQNLMINGQSTLKLDQQGNGDINPTWLNLISNNSLANYESTITLTPKTSAGGILLHLYKEYEHFYFDIRSAVLECSAQIAIEEIGGKNGAIAGIHNASQAFAQADWNYGKIGNMTHAVGVDDIQLKVGGKYKTTSDAFDIFATGFGLIQVPTGSGGKSEWLFEPLVGSTHWGLGGGFEAMIAAPSKLKFLLGGDYRYFMPGSEIRSFDLTNNGQWSRYLGIQDTYGLPDAPPTNPLPGINYLTQSAEIQGLNQINLYLRLEKTMGHSTIEFGYNFFYKQEETIGDITSINSNHGIYTLTGPSGGGGGVSTSSYATINEDVTPIDTTPVILTTAMFDKSSAQVKSFTSNSANVIIQRIEDTYTYGIGANIEIAQSAGAISTWAIWVKFEYLFSKGSDRSSTSENFSDTFESSELFNNIQDTLAPQVDSNYEVQPNMEIIENTIENNDTDSDYNDDDNDNLNWLNIMIHDDEFIDFQDEDNEDEFIEEYDILSEIENIVEDSRQDTLQYSSKIIINYHELSPELEENSDLVNSFAIKDTLIEEVQNEEINNDVHLNNNATELIVSDEDISEIIDDSDATNEDDTEYYNESELLTVERLLREAIHNQENHQQIITDEDYSTEQSSDNMINEIIDDSDFIEEDAEYYDNDLLILEELLIQAIAQNDNDDDNEEADDNEETLELDDTDIFDINNYNNIDIENNDKIIGINSLSDVISIESLDNYYIPDAEFDISAHN